jgi:hypothetical protein
VELVKVVGEFAKANEFDSKMLEPGNEQYLESKSRFSKTFFSRDESFISAANVVNPSCLSIAVYIKTGDAGRAAELKDDLINKLKTQFSLSAADQDPCS